MMGELEKKLGQAPINTDWHKEVRNYLDRKEDARKAKKFIWTAFAITVLSLLMVGCTTQYHLTIGVNKFCEESERDKKYLNKVIKRGIYPHKGAIKCVGKKYKRW